MPLPNIRKPLLDGVCNSHVGEVLYHGPCHGSICRDLSTSFSHSVRRHYSRTFVFMAMTPLYITRSLTWLQCSIHIIRCVCYLLSTLPRFGLLSMYFM